MNEARVPRLHECSLKPAAQDANKVKNDYTAISRRLEQILLRLRHECQDYTSSLKPAAQDAN